MARRQQQVSTRLTLKEKKALDDLIQEWGVTATTVLRRLIIIFNHGKINIPDLIKKEEIDESEERIYVMRISLSDLEKKQFLNAIKGWGFRTSAVLHRLVLAFLSGDIPRNILW